MMMGQMVNNTYISEKITEHSRSPKGHRAKGSDCGCQGLLRAGKTSLVMVVARNLAWERLHRSGNLEE